MTPGDYFAITKEQNGKLYCILNKQSCFVLSIRFIDQIEINLFVFVLFSLSSPKLRGQM